MLPNTFLPAFRTLITTDTKGKCINPSKPHYHSMFLMLEVKIPVRHQPIRDASSLYIR